MQSLRLLVGACLYSKMKIRSKSYIKASDKGYQLKDCCDVNLKVHQIAPKR